MPRVVVVCLSTNISSSSMRVGEAQGMFFPPGKSQLSAPPITKRAGGSPWNALLAEVALVFLCILLGQFYCSHKGLNMQTSYQISFRIQVV